MCGVAKADDIIRANNQFSVDFAAVNFGYKETGPGGAPLDSESASSAPGVSATISLMQDWGLRNLYFMARYTYFNGNTAYDGSLMGGTFGSFKNTDGAVINDVDVRLGKGFGFGSSVMLTPYLGVGWHEWGRNLPGASGYHEDYSDGYVGGGLLVQAAPIDRLVISANGLGGTTFDPSMTASDNGGVHLPPLSAFNLGSRPIYMAGLSADYAITTLLHVNAGIEWTDFTYGRSQVQPPGLLEPNSSTHDLTFRVGVGIAFGGGSDWGSPLK
jgi:hypothetical protein